MLVENSHADRPPGMTMTFFASSDSDSPGPDFELDWVIGQTPESIWCQKLPSLLNEFGTVCLCRKRLGIQYVRQAIEFFLKLIPGSAFAQTHETSQSTVSIHAQEFFCLSKVQSHPEALLVL
jgi:hypothetical protein